MHGAQPAPRLGEEVRRREHRLDAEVVARQPERVLHKPLVRLAGQLRSAEGEATQGA